MSKTKYPIKRELFPYSKFTPSVDRRFVKLAQKGMKTPKFALRDPDVEVRKQRIPAFREGEIELLIMIPKGIQTPAPCLVNIHGGGCVFEAAGSHYRHALAYAKNAPCIVVFVLYRLAPGFPFPYPQEDCYAAFCWVSEHAEELGVDRTRIGIAGDSAGGTLTVTTTKRMKIVPADRQQMEDVIASAKDPELKKAYTEMLEGCLEHPEQWDWYAMWIIENEDGIRVGDLCFKGYEDGKNPEIGYGIDEEFQGKGYATEAVKLALAWAFSHPGVAAVEAETDPDNIASQRVLAKCGFKPAGMIGEEGPRFIAYKE